MRLRCDWLYLVTSLTDFRACSQLEPSTIHSLLALSWTCRHRRLHRPNRWVRQSGHSHCTNLQMIQLLLEAGIQISMDSKGFCSLFLQCHPEATLGNKSKSPRRISRASSEHGAKVESTDWWAGWAPVCIPPHRYIYAQHSARGLGHLFHHQEIGKLAVEIRTEL